MLKKALEFNFESNKNKFIIAWWEKNRLIYNAFIVPSALLISGINYLLTDRFFQNFVFIDFIISTLIANILYTSGWIIDILLKERIPKGESLIIRKFLFISGLVLSVFIIICLGILKIIT